MRILIFDAPQEGSIGYNIAKIMGADGHDVKVYSAYFLLAQYLLKTKDICQNPMLFNQKSSMSLKRLQQLDLIEKNLDMILVVQQSTTILNDIQCPVMYYHIDLLKRPLIINPSILLVARAELPAFYERYYPELWYNVDQECGRFYLPPAYDSESPRELPKKDIDEPMWPGYIDVNHRGVFGGEWDKYDCITQTFHEHTQKTVLYLEKLDQKHADKNEPAEFCIINKSCDGKDYWYWMNHAKIFIAMQYNHVYFGRRIIDAMGSKTLCLIFCEGPKAEAFFKQIGLVHGKNCYFWRSWKELRSLAKNLKNKSLNREKVVKMATVWLSQHTYRKTVDALYGILDEYNQHQIQLARKTDDKESLIAQEVIDAQIEDSINQSIEEAQR